MLGRPPTGSIVGRYTLFDEIAAGGMASVHVGRLLGSAGFARTVAVKRLHPRHAKDPEFVAMFLDEARLAARVVHPNVVTIVDVVADDGEIFLVMDYVPGETLCRLTRAAADRHEVVPPEIAAGILGGVLHGLHAAHEATAERGGRLNIVHRDVSPQNILVGVDGIARVLDFGIAKAVARSQSTQEGLIKGKLAYMSPEQLRKKGVDRRTDVFAASVVLWETLTGTRLFAADDPGAVVASILNEPVPPPTSLNPELPRPLDAVVQRGLAKSVDDRYATARDMALALERALTPAGPAAIGDWVRRLARDTLDARAQRIAEIEGGSPALPSGDPYAQARRRAELPTEVAASPGEVTSLSLVTQARRVVGRASRRSLAVVALAAGMLGAAVTAAALHPRPGTEPTAPSRAAAAEGPALDDVAAAPSPAPPVLAPVVSGAQSAAPAPPKAPGSAPAAAKRRACDPPYTWDKKRGIKVFNESCF